MNIRIETAGEWLARQLRWRWPLSQFSGLSHRHKGTPRQMRISDVEKTFASANLAADDVVMVHSGIGNLLLLDGVHEIDAPDQVVRTLLSWLREVAGPSVTLVMPTYPMYPKQGAFMDATRGERLVYNPNRNFSKTGLLSECFRRQRGTLRSPIPLQSLAANGPKAEAIIEPDKLPTDIPPHGLGTPHHRLCLSDALVIGLGVPLHPYVTLVHVAEDLNFEANRARNFYRRRYFTVVLDKQHEVTMWQRRPEMARVFCFGRFRRDILSQGILHEAAGGTPDWLRARPLLNFMVDQTSRGSTYPYYLPWLAGPFSE